ncbi:ankyrin repeat domain-containing protein 34B [Megalops cyprinoides]|uniref:ankyrin repeat domain-containing protein 34B n=1 Tax=Megalops cyprinoides TaxID=118141 RepID=UPI0018647551|nr:ankyrin repeat domain-containing protein 34B [Megalops cyprinoides]
MGEPQEYLADGTPLITAAQLGKLRLVRLLVEGGAQVNERNQRGETPLLAACKAMRGDQSGSSALRLLQYLLEKQADPNAQDKAGRSALMYACMEKAGPEVAAALIGAGADPSMEDYAGASALVYAINAHDQATLQVLLDACRERGRDIIIIATDLSTNGGSVTRRYLNVPPSPDSSPVSCMSPSEIELKTSSPSSETEGENIFDFKGDGKRGGGTLPDLGPGGRRPHSHRLRSEPWLAIHNLAHLRSSYEEGLRQGALCEDEEEEEEEDGKPLPPSDMAGLPGRRRSSLHPYSGLDLCPAETGGARLTLGRTSRKASVETLPSSSGSLLPPSGRRNTLPALQDVPLLQLPSLTLDHSSSDSQLQAPPTATPTLSPGRRGLLSSPHHSSSLSLASADAALTPDRRKGSEGLRSQLKTSFLPPLPVSPTHPSRPPPASAPSELQQTMPRLGGRWGRRLQRRHSIQLEQMGSSEEILIL